MSSSKIFFADISSKFLLFFAEVFLLLNNQLWQNPIMENCFSFISKLKTRKPELSLLECVFLLTDLAYQPSHPVVSRLARYTALRQPAGGGRSVGETK